MYAHDVDVKNIDSKARMFWWKTREEDEDFWYLSQLLNVFSNLRYASAQFA